MSRHKEIFEQAGVYSLSTQLTQLITLIAAVLSRRFLGPAQVGIWATLQILVEYAKYSSLGTLYSVARELPYLIGKGEHEKAGQIKNVVFTTVMIGSSLMGLGIFLYAFLTRGRYSHEVTYGLFFISGVIVLQRFSDLLIGLLRCYKKFHLASAQMIWSSVVNAVLVAVLTYYFKIFGFIWAIGLSFLFNIAFIYAHHNFHFRFQFDRSRFRGIVQFGFPLMILGVMTTVLRSIDKIMVARLLGFEALGFYSIALMVNSYIGSFANSVAIVLVPHLQEKYGAQDNPKDLVSFLEKTGHAFSLMTPVLIGAAWMAAPYFIALFLPQFISGIPAMKILGFSMFFLALAQPYNDFLITIKKHLALFPLLAATSIFALILNYGMIRAGYGIAGVALATTVTSFFNYAVIYFFASRSLTDGKTALAKFTIFMSRGAYLLLICVLIDFWLPANLLSFQSALIRLLLFGLLYLPLMANFNARFSVLSLVREKFFGYNSTR